MIALDGGGVLPDVEFADGYRLRVHLTDYPGGDVTVYVEGGVLHVAGQYGTVHAERVAPNRVALSCVPPGRDRV